MERNFSKMGERTFTIPSTADILTMLYLKQRKKLVIKLFYGRGIKIHVIGQIGVESIVNHVLKNAKVAILYCYMMEEIIVVKQ